MRKKIILAITIFFLMPPAYSQVQLSGTLSNYVIDFLWSDAFPMENGNDYQHPSAAQRTQWENAVTAILQGNYSLANTTASGFGYRIVEFYDETILKTYYILEKQSTSTNHWGMFVYNPNATRAKLFIQSPHPRYDTYTGRQGAYIFRYQDCRAFFVSGTHRCNSTTNSGCSGTTTVCGPSGPYKISDQPHTVDGTLQITTNLLLQQINNLVVIQPHGFSKGDDDPHLIMSNGTRITPSADYVAMLRDNLLLADDTLTFKIAHIDLTWDRLIALTNTQGRLINNSVNPCSNNATQSTGRFIHIEQAFTLRNSTATRKKLSDAVGLTFPVFSTVSSGNWNTADIWMSEQVPTAASDVRITNGQTITISGSVDCRSIQFGDNNSKLSLDAGAILNVYGDFTLASQTHNAFSSWGAGAKIVFKGSEAVQTIKNLYKDASTFSSSFIELVIDKEAGKVTTEDSVRLNIGTNLEIISGTFELGYRADIEGRNLTGSSASTPTITVQSGGVFNMIGSLSHIRSGNSGTNPIGKMTLYGTAIFRSTSSLGIAIGNIDVKNGGVLIFDSFSNTYPQVINTGLITIENSGRVEVNSAVNFYHASSSVDLQSGGNYKINANPVDINNSFPPIFTNNGTVEYSREGEQSVKNITYTNLTISGSGDKTLTGSIEVQGALSIIGGSLVTGDHTVTMGESATLGENAGNTVVGKILSSRNAVQNIQNNFGGIGVIINAAGNSPGATTITRTTGTEITQGANKSIKRYFDIIPASNTNLNATLTFVYDESELNGLLENTLVLFKSSDNGTSWYNEEGSVDTALNTITKSGVNSFSRWTAASVDHPLPVEFSTFTIAKNKNSAILNWETTTEFNIRHYEIERISSRADSQRNWEKIGELSSKGYSVTIQNYNYTDNNLNTGFYSYRIKIIDNDGTIGYSPEVDIEIEAPDKFELHQNYPNPFNPVTTISITLAKSEHIKVEVVAITGELVAVLANGFFDAGYYNFNFDGSNLSSGLYFCRLKTENFIKTIKLSLMK